MSLRIISGSLRGKKIMSLPGNSTRPTPDMVREAIFSIIGDEIKGCSFLELYAGTGAVGIEAVSRGAEKALLVEENIKAAEIIKKNIDLCGISEKCKLTRWDIESNLNCLKGKSDKFDLVFLDPPYDKDLVWITLKHLSSCGALGEKARVIVQHSKREPLNLQKMKGVFEVEKERRYGKNLVSFLRYVL